VGEPAAAGGRLNCLGWIVLAVLLAAVLCVTGVALMINVAPGR